MELHDIQKEISEAQKGSDTYGLIENIAFSLHLRKPSRSSDDNWFDAQNRLSRWCDYHINHMKDLQPPIESDIHKSLNHRAYNKHEGDEFWDEPSSPFDDWMYALRDKAEQVIWQSRDLI